MTSYVRKAYDSVTFTNGVYINRYMYLQVKVYARVRTFTNSV